MTNYEDRLSQCQAALTQRGVKDVKFFFGSVSEKPFSALSSDVAEALEAVVNKNYKDLPAINDSVRKK